MIKPNSKWRFYSKQSFFAVLYGVLSAMGVNLFLSNAHSYSVGFIGIAQLLNAILHPLGIPLSIGEWLLILNVPLFIFAWRVFGMRYIIFSLFALLANVIFLRVIPSATLVTDPLTNTIVGNALIGAGVGLCFNQGFTTGGADILTTFFQSRYHWKVGFINNVINGLILLGAAIYFGPGRIIYSLIGMIVVSWLMDYLFVMQKETSVLILTKHRQEVQRVLKHYVHGATLLHGTGVYTEQETDVILIVVQRGELPALKQLIRSVDTGSWIITQPANVEMGNYHVTNSFKD
ncbi:YitT family protein [Limosilactobacillus sp.]|uniref:YitT family protein n=1 Tax=Limosilactobacillus sp. TaxID=2773925 RepID=UPI00345E80D8